uniref:Zn-cluster domain-containing protein n=1 Tax=Cucumis melo TaxID=3656 RepID=A0A9I9EE82_CUCME
MEAMLISHGKEASKVIPWKLEQMTTPSIETDGKGKAFNNTRVKHRVKRSIKVPAISNKLAHMMIYSCRKYDRKPIKGSPHPSHIGLKAKQLCRWPEDR